MQGPEIVPSAALSPTELLLATVKCHAQAMDPWHYFSNLCLGNTGYISWPELNLVGISCQCNCARNVQNEISWFFIINQKDTVDVK